MNPSTGVSDQTLLIMQAGRACDVVPYLADRRLSVVSVRPSEPSPGYVTVGVRRATTPETPSPLLVVGERHAPGGTGPAFSGSGPSARRLSTLLGAPVLEVATTVNLLAGPGAGWNAAAARGFAAELHRSWPGWIVACGRRVAAAFGLSTFLEWDALRGSRLGAIPHPSGRCRLWNDPAYVDAARLFLQPAVASALAVDPVAEEMSAV